MRFKRFIEILTMFVLLTMFRDVVLLDFSPGNRENYGPFVAKWHHYQVCRGPKMKNVSLFQSELETDGNSYGGIFNFTFPVTTRLDEIKISVFTIKEGKKPSQLYFIKLDNPCQHLVLGALMEARFKVKNCIMKKGFYSAYINFTSFSHEFFGNSFFYGDFLFKAIMLSKNGNIGCLTFYTDFKKKE